MTTRTLLGIVTACESEAALVRRHLHRQGQQITSVGRLWRGTIFGQEVVLLRSGMGTEHATLAATWLVHHYPLHGLLSIGFAGGLQTALSTGDIVLPQQVLALAGTSAQGTSIKPERLRPDARLAHLATIAAQRTHLPSHHGTLLSVPEVLIYATDKTRLGECVGAHAVDMESYSIGQVALGETIPFMTLRTIFDTCHENIPFQVADFTSIDGTVQPIRTLQYLVSHPHLLLHILPAGKKVRRAGRSLDAWLQHFLPLLSQQTPAREDLQCRL